jgi:inhibitor of KinA sporulation pathway (predicted exonuclease)
MKTSPELKRGLYLDLEYTCWEDDKPPEAQYREIIQMGVVEMNYELGEITRGAEYWIYPLHPISEFCTQFTGITLEEIKAHRGQRFGDALRAFVKAYGPAKKIIYTWGEDDETVLQEAGLLHLHGDDVLAHVFEDFNIINLSVVFHHTFRITEAMSLEKAMEFMGLKFEGRAHNALVDAKNLARLHQAWSLRMKLPETQIASVE